MSEPQPPEELSLDKLKSAVRSAAALRLRVKLNGLGGDGDKVFPPTYAGGIYAVEDRRIDGKVVRCALLDSVQSQANRMEEALQSAFLPSWRELDPAIRNVEEPVLTGLPILAVHVPNHGWVTSLTAPHRIHDAIIRDSEIEETASGKSQRIRFRESAVGKEIVAARLHDAVAFYKHCPTALIFGTWDSTAGEGLDSAKVPRAVVSEIVAVDITPGVRTGSRIDPLGIRAGSATIYRLKDCEDDWTLCKAEAALTKKDEPGKLFGKGKPSDINHGNVTPDLPRFDQQEVRRQNLAKLPDILETTPLEFRHEVSSGDGRIRSHSIFQSEDVRIRPGAVKPGGITMAYALHTWALSLTQLRRLRFPVKNDVGEQAVNPRSSGDRMIGGSDQRNEAARIVLAALALYALALQREEGYWLRSRCELVPEDPLVLEQVGGSGGTFSLGSADKTRTILDMAVEEARQLGLEWSGRVAVLTPADKLMELVRRSDASGPETEEEESTGAGTAG